MQDWNARYVMTRVTIYLHKSLHPKSSEDQPNAREVEGFSVSCLAVAEEERRVVAEVCSLFPAARAAGVGRKRNKADKKGRCNDPLDNCS